MELVQLLASVRRHIRLILLVGAITSAAGLVLAQGQTSSASASSRIVLAPAETILEHGDRIDVGQVLNRPIMAANFSEIVVGDRVLEQARHSIALPPAQSGGVAVDATIAPESNVITITVSAADTDVVAALIQPLTDQGIVSFEGIYPLVRAEVIDLDASPDVSAPAGPLFAVIVGLIVGLIVGVFGGLLLDAMKMPAPALVRDRGPWLVHRVPEPAIDLSDTTPAQTIGARSRTVVGFSDDGNDAESESASATASDAKSEPETKLKTVGGTRSKTRRTVDAKTQTKAQPQTKTKLRRKGRSKPLPDSTVDGTTAGRAERAVV